MDGPVAAKKRLDGPQLTSYFLPKQSDWTERNDGPADSCLPPGGGVAGER